MRTHRLLFVVLAALSLVATACAGDSDPKLATTTSAPPSLTITSPKDGARIAGNVVSLQMQTAFPIMKADGDTSGKTGHLHAFVDVAPVAPGEVIPSGNPQIIHSATSPIVVTGLTPGEHVIWIVLGDGTHTAFKNPARDKVAVTVT